MGEVLRADREGGQERSGGLPPLSEGVIRLPDLVIGGMSPRELERVFSSNRRRINHAARYLLRSRDFSTLPAEQTISPIIATPSIMGINGSNPEIDKVYERASEFGWGLSPAEVGLHLHRVYDQPEGEELLIAMIPIPDFDDDLNIFGLSCDSTGLLLSACWAESDTLCLPDDKFVFTAPPK